MKVTINGEQRTVQNAPTVAALLAELDLSEFPGIGVELNGTFVTREEHDTTTVPPDATIEIVRFVGGG